MAKRKGIMRRSKSLPNADWAKPALSGVTYFFVGTLQHAKKKDVATLIEREGGKVANSLSGNVNYLVVGNTRSKKSGGKGNAKSSAEKKAASLNAKQGAAIEILDEIAFHQTLVPTPERVIEMLKAGVEGIQFWEERWSYHWLQIDLEISGAKLRNLDLSQLHMPNCTLNECDLSGSHLNGSGFGSANSCKFDRAKMQNVEIGLATDCRFRDVEYSGLKFEKAERCDFQKSQGAYLTGSFFECDLRKAKIESAWLNDAENCNFAGAELQDSNTGLQQFQDNYSNNNFEKADLREIDLTVSEWVNCNWNRANLERADLSDTTFRACSFVGANLKSARLSDATFNDVDFTRADLRDADLMDASLKGVTLKDADFRSAVTAGLRVEEADVATARGLTIVELVAKGAIGSNVRKLQKVANQSDNLYTSIRVRLGESWYELSVNGFGSFCNGSMNGLSEDNELSWLGSYKLFGEAILEVAGRACMGTADISTVTVKRSKCPLKPKECKELATRAWAEVFDLPVSQ